VKAVTEELVAKEVQRILDWARGKSSISDHDLSLAAVEAGLRRGRWHLVKKTAMQLVKAKDRRVAPLIARFLESSDYEPQKTEILIALEDIDGPRAAKIAPSFFRSTSFQLRATAAGVATTLPEYDGAGPALKFIRSKGTAVKREDYASVVAALTKSRSPDSKKLLDEITGFDATKRMRWPGFLARVNTIRNLSNSGVPNGLEYYRALLASKEPTRNLLETDMPPIKVGDARKAAHYIAYEIIHHYAPEDRAIVAIRKETTSIDERLKRLIAWVDGKITKMKR
jgi:hypothetical protein